LKNEKQFLESQLTQKDCKLSELKNNLAQKEEELKDSNK